uniref:Nodule cysteine-rich protein 1 n=1 Tax=Cicer arietinum TaxID=3827 RepID=A0A0U8RBT4_CICAR|nr:TPA_exp: nodule cysteine-rich protein 1 [Cicer arietinum]
MAKILKIVYVMILSLLLCFVVTKASTCKDDRDCPNTGNHCIAPDYMGCMFNNCYCVRRGR